jgi:hypothetical protein
MTTSVDFNMGETPFTPPIDAQAADWPSAHEADLAPHQEINDRRASIESAETMRLVRAL